MGKRAQFWNTLHFHGSSSFWELEKCCAIWCCDRSCVLIRWHWMCKEFKKAVHRITFEYIYIEKYIYILIYRVTTYIYICTKKEVRPIRSLFQGCLLESSCPLRLAFGAFTTGRPKCLATIFCLRSVLGDMLLVAMPGAPSSFWLLVSSEAGSY